ncbi:hypothetical protein [Eggerthella sinensis]|uniref:hypothetical protein n=1 Tax=Eggerthella sinensis TaxID=242230 RepID=UPI00248E5CBF|nr:hypothetical protein [Eggerthella sinensis]
MEPWSAFYTRSAIDFILNEVESERVASKLFAMRELLETSPELGRSYDPDYPAARPPFPCRYISVPDTPFTVYYLKDEEKRQIVLFCIEYQRLDPNRRFSSVDWAVVDW